MINKKITFLSALLGLGSVLFNVGCFDVVENSAKYNVLFISVDDLNVDLESYGHPLVQSPNLSRLADEGVQFDRAYCQYPLCNPSRASVMTGLTPDQTGVYDLQTHFRENRPNIIAMPELFKQNGYYTARVGKVYHNHMGNSNLDDPLSWVDAYDPIGREKEDRDRLVRLMPDVVDLGVNQAFDEGIGGDEDYADGIIASQAIDLMRNHKEDPFFLAVGFHLPHVPHVLPAKYFSQYPIGSIELPPMSEGDLEDVPSIAQFTKPPNWGLSELDQKKSIRSYYAAISYMDAQVGRVLDELENLGLRDRTVVVFWSDHGFNLGEHGQWQKRSLFEKSARVPMIVSVPGRVKGVKSSRTVELIDLYPTLAELCQLPAPEYLLGQSMLPLLKNPQADWGKPAFTQVLLSDPRGRQFTERMGFGDYLDQLPVEVLGPDSMGRSVKTERWRYTEWDQGKLGVELYDEENDPNEFRNLASIPEYSEVVREMSDHLSQRFQQ